MRLSFLVLFLLFLFSFSYSLDILFYYGQGCPHCATTESVFDSLKSSYNLSITSKEIYQNSDNRREMFELYANFSQDPNLGGVPTTLVGGKILVIGGLPRESWSSLFSNCSSGNCPSGIYSNGIFNQIEEKDVSSNITFPALVGAALVDSINPCTIAVMVMLLGVVLVNDGKKRAFISGLLFSGVIFISYFLMGLGILRALASSGLTNIFYLLITGFAFILAILEIKAYFDYRPGFFAIEMPMFLRPYTKQIISGATSYPGVAFAALLCSLFLLPCSSGPYLIVLSLLAKSVTLQVLFYLLLYNFVFVLPMILIAFAVYLGKTSVGQIRDIKDKYVRQVHLISGLILFVLFLLMLQQTLSLLGF